MDKAAADKAAADKAATEKAAADKATADEAAADKATATAAVVPLPPPPHTGMTDLAEALWAHPRSRRIARECAVHPFLSGLFDGTLLLAHFNSYIAQDSYYLKAFQAAYVRGNQLAVETGDVSLASEFLQLACGVDDELKMHNAYVRELGIDVGAVQPLPATSAYVAFLGCHDAAHDARTQLMVLAATMTPCMRLYAFLGRTLADAHARDPSIAAARPAPYERWIAEYNTPDFEALAVTLETLLGKAAASVPDAQDLCERAYLRAMDLELEFFSAHAAAPTSTNAVRRALLAAAAVPPPRVLIVAGSDSGGGAGIQADIKACCAGGVFSMSAVTALTAQNTCGVLGVFPVPAGFVREQIRACIDDLGADVLKTGMLASADVVECIVAEVRRARMRRAHPALVVVADPVMVSTSGHALLDPSAVACVRETLLPVATILTPNLHEARLLLGMDEDAELESEGAMIQAAMQLLKLGPKWVLLKGGHGEGEGSLDVLVGGGPACDDGEGDVPVPVVKLLRSARIRTKHTHGTGCSLASSVAAGLAAGLTVPDAVEAAKDYVHGAIVHSAHLALGAGEQGPLNHMWSARGAVAW